MNTADHYGGNSADFVIRAGKLKKYTGAAADVVIPNSVTIIGRRAFSGCAGLTGVVIPDSVTSIEKDAFYRCSSLTSVLIPDSVTSIGEMAFSGCSSLTNVTIGNGVTSIGNYAFAFCTSLTDILIPGSVAVIGNRAFQSCRSLRSVTISDSDTRIVYFAFSACDSLTTFNASEEWKQKHYYLHKCLHAYAPNTPRKSGCYVATAVYGSYDCPQVWVLRRFRDETLAVSSLGRAFIRTYYAVSPTLVRWFGKTAWFQKFWRRRLDRLVARLSSRGVSDAPYHDR